MAVATSEGNSPEEEKKERKKKPVVPGGEVSVAHGAELCSTKCTPHAVRNKTKISFHSRKPFSALLCSSFHMKMPPGFDKTAAAATSTLNSLVEANVRLSARFLCFFFGFSVGFKRSMRQLLPAFITTKREMIGYGIPRLKMI